MVRLPENMESALYEELFRPEKVLTGVVPGELAVITAPMTEMQYMEAEEKCGRVISRTRLY